MLYNKYLNSTFDDPKDYYWGQIHQSLNSLTQREESKAAWINSIKKSLNEAAIKLNVPVDSKNMNAQLCFKACQAILMETVLTLGEPPHVAYALEYFNYAPTRFDLGENPRSVNISPSSFYNRLLDRLESTLLTKVNSALLNNSNNSFSNTIVDLDKIRRELRFTINDFYSSNPALKQSTNHIPPLQTKVKKIFSDLSLDFDKTVNSSYSL